jgi:Zn finger protein HypA/HybF involved in hydrogenase expression
MNMDEIIRKHADIERRLMFALSTMERKSTINEIHKELIDLQKQCPHFSVEHSFAIIDGECPYCGKQLEAIRNDKGY